MNFFLLIFLLLLAAVTLVLLVAFYYVRKGIRFFRRFSTGDMSEEEFQRMANKYYRRTENGERQFDKDYFKGSGWRQGQDGQQTVGRRQRPTSHAAAGGVTIEDRRDPGRAKKKIFASDEGEYVDFTES